MLIHFLGGDLCLDTASPAVVVVSKLRYVEMIDRIGQALRRI